MNVTDVTGLFGSASVLAASTLLLPPVKEVARQKRALLLGTFFLLVLIPFNGLSFAAYLRGGMGDISITSLLLVWGVIVRPWINCATPNRIVLFGLLSLSALYLYPMALGLSLFDPYRLGYGNTVFVAALLCVALLTWLLKVYWVAITLACAILAWSFGWYESTNLWDYLLDPFVSIYSLVVITSMFWEFQGKKK